MATDKNTATDQRSNPFLDLQALTELRGLATRAHEYHALRRDSADDWIGTRIALRRVTCVAEARGFLSCLVALDLLTHDDEIGWYEFICGVRPCPPVGVDTPALSAQDYNDEGLDRAGASE